MRREVGLLMLRRFALLLVFAVAIAATCAVAGVPRWLVLVVCVPTVFWFMLASSVRAFSMAPRGPVPCPRCGRAPRGRSGWCAPCTAELTSHPLPADHPFTRFIDANVRFDPPALVACLTDPVGVRVGDKRAVSRPASVLGASLRVGMFLYPQDRVSRVLGTYLDPSDGSLVWNHALDTGRGRLGVGPLSAETVIRYRYEGDLIAEIAQSPAL